MSTAREDFQRFLDEQRAEYKAALPGKMAEVHALWALAAPGEDAAQPLADLQRLAHTLAGTAGTLGFRDVGTAAKALELLVEEAGIALTPAQRADMTLAIAALQASMPA